MRSLVEAQRNDGNGDTIDKALKWLGDPLGDYDPGSLFARRRKWAACYTHALFTFGADATQSGEVLEAGGLDCVISLGHGSWCTRVRTEITITALPAR